MVKQILCGKSKTTQEGKDKTIQQMELGKWTITRKSKKLDPAHHKQTLFKMD